LFRNYILPLIIVVRDLGVLLDSELTVKQHASKTVTPASTIDAGHGNLDVTWTSIP